VPRHIPDSQVKPTSHVSDLPVIASRRQSKHSPYTAENTTPRLQESRKTVANMPAIRTSKNRKPPPDGFDDIEDTLLEFQNKMKDAENASAEGKKKHEMLWPVFQITHQRMSCPVHLSPTKPPTNSYRHRLPLHLRPLLRKRSHQQTPLRLAAQKQLRRREPDRQVEEARL